MLIQKAKILFVDSECAKHSAVSHIMAIYDGIRICKLRIASKIKENRSRLRLIARIIIYSILVIVVTAHYRVTQSLIFKIKPAHSISISLHKLIKSFLRNILAHILTNYDRINNFLGLRTLLLTILIFL